jgi:hypothetical protein
VKRQKQTFFIPCTEKSDIRSIKSNIVAALKGSEKDEGILEDNMRLLLPAPKSTVLEDGKDLTHYEIKNDDELNVVFQISENQWEQVFVASTDISTAAATS